MALILGAALSTALLTPHVALAWANGGDYGNGFGTHDWVLHEADRLAASRGYDWLRLGSALRATDNPDTRLQDTYHHVYDVWGARYGDAPDRCQELFARAAAQLRAGDAAAASRTFGLLSHYYADICNPTHTDSRDREARMHAAYEGATQTRTDAKGENRSWVRFDGIDLRSGAQRPAARAATFAHRFYLTLVDHYLAHGWDATVARISRRSLDRAVNDLADLIVSVRKASR